MVQEGKDLSENTLFELFELVNIEEVTLAQLTAFRPILLEVLLDSSTSSRKRDQAKRALKRLEEKGIT
ncbi:MAG: hypothetical protein ACFFC7_32260 [Candidatus Hermodarchaeota archaeon]